MVQKILGAALAVVLVGSLAGSAMAHTVTDDPDTTANEAVHPSVHCHVDGEVDGDADFSRVNVANFLAVGALFQRVEANRAGTGTSTTNVRVSPDGCVTVRDWIHGVARSLASGDGSGDLPRRILGRYLVAQENGGFTDGGSGAHNNPRSTSNGVYHRCISVGGGATGVGGDITCWAGGVAVAASAVDNVWAALVRYN